MLCLMDASSSREIPLTSTTELFNVLLRPEEDVATNERLDEDMIDDSSEEDDDERCID